MNKLYCLIVVLICAGVWWVGTKQISPTTVPAPAPIVGPVKVTGTLRVYTTTGCVPCRVLHKSFEDPAVKKFLKGWTVHEIKSSMRARIGGVSSYPTVIAYHGNPEVSIGRFEGSKSPAELLAWLESLHLPIVP